MSRVVPTFYHRSTCKLLSDVTLRLLNRFSIGWKFFPSQIIHSFQWWGLEVPKMTLEQRTKKFDHFEANQMPVFFCVPDVRNQWLSVTRSLIPVSSQTENFRKSPNCLVLFESSTHEDAGNKCAKSTAHGNWRPRSSLEAILTWVLRFFSSGCTFFPASQGRNRLLQRVCEIIVDEFYFWIC